MSTGFSLEQRLQVVYEVYLVIGNNQEVAKADSPKVDAHNLVCAILQDRTYGINTRSLLCRVLKKSPVWKPLLPFLTNADTTCKNKGCEHYPHNHESGPCKGQRYVGWNSANRTSIYAPCTCAGYTPRQL